MTEKSMSQVCDLLGKTCSGPVKYYLTEHNHIGIRVNQSITEVSSGDDLDDSDLRSSPGYLKILKSIEVGEDFDTHVLSIKTPLDLDIKELDISGHKFPIQKFSYAKSYTYVIKAPKVQTYRSSIISAFALEAYLEQEVNEDESDTTETNSEQTPPPAPMVAPTESPIEAGPTPAGRPALGGNTSLPI